MKHCVMLIKIIFRWCSIVLQILKQITHHLRLKDTFGNEDVNETFNNYSSGIIEFNKIINK